MYLFVQLFIYLFIYFFLCSFIYIDTSISFRSSFESLNLKWMRLSVFSSTVNLSIHHFIHPSFHPSIHHFIHPSFHSSIILFIYHSIHPSFHSSIIPSTFLSIHYSIHPSFFYLSHNPSLDIITPRQLIQHHTPLLPYLLQSPKPLSFRVFFLIHSLSLSVFTLFPIPPPAPLQKEQCLRKHCHSSALHDNSNFSKDFSGTLLFL